MNDGGVRWRDDAARLLSLGWPIFAGQAAVLAFGTIDTLLLGRSGTSDLAALAIGTAAYVSVFVGLMGIVMAISPLAARAYGAGRLDDCGHLLGQTLWLALGLSLIGGLMLRHPEPILTLAAPSAEVAQKVRAYLGALAWALPAALLFAALRGFHAAIGRPRVVMLIQFAGLGLKLPLSVALAFGASVPAIFGAIELPALGVEGCGWATAIVMWMQVLMACGWVRRDPAYRLFGLNSLRLPRPAWTDLRALLQLGVPMGLSILVEVTGFTFMAFFIARLGDDAVAGHQIAANLTGMLFMMPLALGQATTALVSQRLGAGDPRAAQRLGRHALGLAIVFAGGSALALMLARDPVVRVFTNAAPVATVALGLLAWLCAFHLLDALQAVLASVLRAYQVVRRPLVIYAAAVLGVGLGGGCVLGFGWLGPAAALQGPEGFWAAGTAGLLVAGIGLGLLLRRVWQPHAMTPSG